MRVGGFTRADIERKAEFRRWEKKISDECALKALPGKERSLVLDFLNQFDQKAKTLADNLSALNIGSAKIDLDQLKYLVDELRENFGLKSGKLELE